MGNDEWENKFGRPTIVDGAKFGEVDARAGIVLCHPRKTIGKIEVGRRLIQVAQPFKLFEVLLHPKPLYGLIFPGMHRRETQ